MKIYEYGYDDVIEIILTMGHNSSNWIVYLSLMVTEIEYFCYKTRAVTKCAYCHRLNLGFNKCELLLTRQ